MIKTITFTGADDSIDPSELEFMQEKYPFIEWGILVSRNQNGTPRFPSREWRHELERYPDLNLSLHLCGAYVRELLRGAAVFIENELGEEFFALFKRVQINTHGVPHAFYEDFTEVLKRYPEKEWIFQYDNVNGGALRVAHDAGVKSSALFDLSHVAGILPDEWPAPLDIKCGYAGGLGPQNLHEQIYQINTLTMEIPVWIDMETKIRNEYDQFDLYKVKTCCEIFNSLPF